MNHGFLRIAIAVPTVKVGNVAHNKKEIQTLIGKADAQFVDVLLFPELSLTGYTCGDLFFQQSLLSAAKDALTELVSHSKGKRPLCIVGLPFLVDEKLYNAAAVFSNGELLGIVPKSYLPNYGEYADKRWFTSGRDVHGIVVGNEYTPFGTDLLFSCKEFPACTIGIEICEDLWAHIPPSSLQAAAGATVLCNLSAATEQIGKADTRRTLIAAQSMRNLAVYAYSGAGFGESTTDAVFSGHGLVYTCGELTLETPQFLQESALHFCDVDLEQILGARRKNTTFGNLPHDVDKELSYTRFPHKIPFSLLPVTRDLIADVPQVPFLPTGAAETHFAEILNMQAVALQKRFAVTKSKTAVIGVSGGLDSAMAMLALCQAFDQMQKPRTDILAITMPGFGTTNTTHDNANDFMRALGVTIRDISIKDSVMQHFSDIGHDPDTHDITYENAQARERTQILMDIANKEQGLVIGTGNLSELALGFTTFGGDHLSMYAINAGIPKTILRQMVHHFALTKQFGANTSHALQRILESPISPELLPTTQAETTQKTEELIGPYILHDFFLYYTLNFGLTPEKVGFLAEHAFADTFDKKTIEKWKQVFFTRFYAQQFKRNCLPDSPKVCAVALSSRTDARFPSDMEPS